MGWQPLVSAFAMVMMIRRHAEGLGGERGAEPSEAANDLIEHEQDTVLIADLAQALQIPLGRDQHTGGAGDRFDKAGRNR